MPRKGTSFTNVHLSDKAHRGLQRLAEHFNYSETRGISRVITDLAMLSAKFEDTRPQHVKETDNDFLPRVWNAGDTRRPRWLGILPTNFLLALAEQYEIQPYITQRPVVIGQTPNLFWRHKLPLYSDNSRIGPVLEAIGIGWLKPVASPDPMTERQSVRAMKRKRRLIGA